MAELKTNPPEQVQAEEYVLVNAYDDMVRTSVRSFMGKMDMCQCEKCFLDACALVFNKQYTHFVTTRRGVLLTKVPEMAQGNQVDMMVAVMEALRKVKESPNH